MEVPVRHRRATQMWRIRIESKRKEINHLVTSGKKVVSFEMDFILNQHRLSVREGSKSGNGRFSSR